MHRDYRLVAVLVGLSLVIAMQSNFTGKVSAVTSTGSVSGVVVDSSYQPFGGVVITVIGTGISTTSNPDGSFYLAGVPSGMQFIDFVGCPAGSYPVITVKKAVYPDQDNPISPAVRMPCVQP